MRSGSLFDMIYARGSSCFSCPPGMLRWRSRNVGGGNGKKQEEQQQRRRDEKAILAIAFQVLWGLEFIKNTLFPREIETKKGICTRSVSCIVT
ncbi:unnamed protein product [Scytosiphon promiscuus]